MLRFTSTVPFLGVGTIKVNSDPRRSDNSPTFHQEYSVPDLRIKNRGRLAESSPQENPSSLEVDISGINNNNNLEIRSRSNSYTAESQSLGLGRGKYKIDVIMSGNSTQSAVFRLPDGGFTDSFGLRVIYEIENGIEIQKVEQ